MAPLVPHWKQPSHPDIQEVIYTEAVNSSSSSEYSTKSVSKISVPPFGFFTKLEFPPCQFTPEQTYATVQVGKDKHLALNSDLLYLNHSCEPSLLIDIKNLRITASAKGLEPGTELTFFYPSTELTMAQGFKCACGTASCRGDIKGASEMEKAALSGMYLNDHVQNALDATSAAGIE